MNDGAVVRPAAWYWIVSVLAFLWNLMGATSYLMQSFDIGPEMGEAQKMLDASIPPWVMGVFAVAVFAGTGGGLGLLLRKRWAKTLLIVSLIAVLAQQFWVLGLSEALTLLGSGAAILPICVIIVSALLVWFAGAAERKGWLS